MRRIPFSRLAPALLAALLASTAPLTVSAQQDGAAAAGDEDLGLSMGEPVADSEAEGQLGQPYVLEVSGDWEIQCVRTSLEHDPCRLHQLLQDQSGNSVATIDLVDLPEQQQASAGATIVTPLETLLTEQITLSVDGGQARRYPFTFCTQVGCVARVGFTEPEVQAFRRGAEAQLSIVPASAPDQQVQLGVSLMGISDGLDRIRELNALNAEAVAEARAEQQAQQE